MMVLGILYIPSKPIGPTDRWVLSLFHTYLVTLGYNCKALIYGRFLIAYRPVLWKWKYLAIIDRDIFPSP